MNAPWRRDFDAARDPYTARNALGITPSAGGPFQPLDGDLTALAGLTGTNTIYYRSGIDTWSPVVMGGNMTFTGGVLDSTGGGSGGNVSNSGTPTAGQWAQWTDATHIQGISTASTPWVLKAGDTMTGKLSIAYSASQGVNLNMIDTNFTPKGCWVGGSRVSDGNSRWWLALGNDTAEAGANTGSDFVIQRYTDAGALIDEPLKITRSSGQITLTQALNLPGAPTSDLHAATKKYVDDADALKAPLASPTFTGDPKAPTPATSDNDTSIATTAYVKAQGYQTGNQTITLSGDASGSGTTAITTTLATVNSNVGTFQGITVNAKGLVTAAANQSYLTGNQTITLSGDITGSGSTAITTAIANNAVTNADLADVATATFKGRTTAGTGDPEDLTATQATALLNTFTSSLKGLAPNSGGGTVNFLRADGTWNVPPGTGGGGAPTTVDYLVRTADATLSAERVVTDTTSITWDWATAGQAKATRAALTGDVTASAGANATTIANDVVSDAKLRNSGALSVIGRSANTTGDPADISATAASGAVLRESGSTIGFGTIATAGIADDAVSNAKLANMAQSTVKGRAAGAGTGDPTDLSVAQLVAVLSIPANIRKFTTSGTYPAVTNSSVKVMVMCKAGGGAGGGCTVAGGYGGSGGEGETTWKLTTAGTLSSQSVTVGAGGVGIAANTNSAGNNGGPSAIGTIVTAGGGGGGGSCTGGGAPGIPGTGGTGDWAMPGACGQSGTINQAGPGYPPAGGGAGGGNLAATSNGAANSGGGGCGGYSTANGSGAGGSGLVVCIEYGAI